MPHAYLRGRFAKKTAVHKEEDKIKKKACPRRKGDWHLNEEWLPVVFPVYPLLALPAGHSIATSPAVISQTPGTLSKNYMLRGTKKCWRNRRRELEFLMFNLDHVYGEPAQEDFGGFKANGGFFPVKATWHLLDLFKPPVEKDEDEEYAKTHF